MMTVTPTIKFSFSSNADNFFIMLQMPYSLEAISSATSTLFIEIYILNKTKKHTCRCERSSLFLAFSKVLSLVSRYITHQYFVHGGQFQYTLPSSSRSCQYVILRFGCHLWHSTVLSTSSILSSKIKVYKSRRDKQLKTQTSTYRSSCTMFY